MFLLLGKANLKITNYHRKFPNALIYILGGEGYLVCAMLNII